MAIYSLQVKAISRGQGRSVVAAAAYRAAEKIVDERLGVVWDFTRHAAIIHSEIMTPEGAPAWALDRERLWNAAEKAEEKSTRRATATTGRDIIVALPHELTAEQRLAMTREFAAALIARYGVVVDFALHRPSRTGDDRNYHAHMLMSTRRLEAHGFGAKTRSLDAYGSGPGEVEWVRAAWEDIANRALERAGFDERIDRRSFKDQGLDREATVHLGPVAAAMERNGEGSDLGDRNRAARASNEERERLAAAKEAASDRIADIEAERQRREDERELRAALRTGAPLKILEAISERRSTFSRTDLNRLLAKTIPDPKMRGDLATAILARPEVIGLRETADAPLSRYTTRDVLKAEREVLRDARALAAAGGHKLDAMTCATVLKDRRHLSREQQAVLRHATGASDLSLIAGEAGTGKSECLAAVRDAYAREGFRVIGMGWTNVVAQKLKSLGFSETSTVASELRRFQRGVNNWDARTVIVVDEAAMLATKHLAELVAGARNKGAKVILAGDDRQLGSIERGGMFGALKEEHGAAELHDVRRVTDEAQRRAFNLMHRQEFQSALDIFDKRGSVHWSESQADARAALIAKWAQDSAAAPGRDRFVFAYTNADVAELNAGLRALRRERGELGPDHRFETTDGPLHFAGGDRIQLVNTDKRAGLLNGMVGTVEKIQGPLMTVKFDESDGPSVTIDAELFRSFRHGYAGTIYKGQGRTLDQTYLYHSPHWRSAASYVALSRHREKVELFVARDTAQDLRQLARQMARVDDCRAASQFQPVEKPHPPQDRQPFARGREPDEPHVPGSVHQRSGPRSYGDLKLTEQQLERLNRLTPDNIPDPSRDHTPGAHGPEKTGPER